MSFQVLTTENSAKELADAPSAETIKVNRGAVGKSERNGGSTIESKSEFRRRLQIRPKKSLGLRENFETR